MLFRNKKSNKKAFTMAEAIIAMAVIGIIAVVLLPIMKKSFFNKEEEMHKKMSYLIEQISIQMADNESYYPKTSDIAKFGFNNTDEVTVDGIKFGGGTDAARKQKFCKLFAHQFKNISSNTITCPENIETGDPSFHTQDGVDWWIPLTTFQENEDGQVKGSVKIKIDVNGKDKGQNCAIGAEGCKRPDTFYYYIKANGSVTLADPVAIGDYDYQIIPEIITKDEEGNVISESGGTLEIAPVDSNGDAGTYSSDSSKFTKLAANSTYMLRAKPKAGYVSNWKTQDGEEEKYGYKKVRTNKLKTNVKLEFAKVKTYCIKLKVNCTQDIQNCVKTKKYKYNCKYESVGTKKGSYTRASLYLDNYNYVGKYRGDYELVCGGSGNLSFGTGADVNYLTACNLPTGDYQLEVTPKGCLNIYPRVSSNKYIQNARLGTQDLTSLAVDIRMPDSGICETSDDEEEEEDESDDDEYNDDVWHYSAGKPY